MPTFRMPNFFRAARGVVLLGVVLAGTQAHSDTRGWTSRYVSRPASELDGQKLRDIYAGATREVVVLNGLWEARKAGEQAWYPVSVPGAFDFQGQVTFRRRLKLDSSLMGRRLQFVALGINTRCTVFVNDKFVGTHVGGHTSLRFPVDSSALFFGKENELRIVVSNRLSSRSTLPLKHRPLAPRNLGGIFRDVFLLALPEISLAGVQVTPSFSSDPRGAKLDVVAEVKTQAGNVPPGDNVRLYLELRDRDKPARVLRSSPVPVRLRPGVVRVIAELLVPKATPWRPEQPKLYALRVVLARGRETLDETRVRIGFSDFRVGPEGFLLNDEAIRLNGVGWVEWWPDAGPCAGWQALERELRAIKKLGANAVRVVSAPPHPFFLHLCDQLGLLVLEDMPLFSIPRQRFDDPGFVKLVSSYLTEMLRRDASHPSLAAWGVGGQSPEAGAHLGTLIGLARRLSPRLVYAVERPWTGCGVPDAVDFTILDCLDTPLSVVEGAAKRQQRRGRKPLVLSLSYSLLSAVGDGGAAVLDEASRGALLKREQGQAGELSQGLTDAELAAQTAGEFVAPFADYPTDHPMLVYGDSEDSNMIAAGLVDAGRSPRVAYKAVQAHFLNENAGGALYFAHPRRSPQIYPVLGVGLILAFLFNYNRSRRLRGNLKRIFLYPHGFYVELRDHRKISAWHTWLIGVTISATFGLILSGIFYHLRTDVLFSQLLPLLLSSDGLLGRLVWLTWHPLLSVAVFSGLTVSGFGVMILSLKLVAFVFGRRLPLVQFYTLVFWAAASFLWLLPLAPIYYRIIDQTAWSSAAYVMPLLFGLWFFARLFRAVRVVFNLSRIKAALLVGVLVATLLAGVAWYYDSRHALFDYLQLYWSCLM